MLTGSSSRAPAAAFAASVLLHAAGVSTLVASPWLADRLGFLERIVELVWPPPQTPIPPEVEPVPSPLRLGVEESSAETLTWVGFATATEHSAPESDADQSAMSQDAGEASAEGSAPTEESAPSELVQVQPEEPLGAAADPEVSERFEPETADDPDAKADVLPPPVPPAKEPPKPASRPPTPTTPPAPRPSDAKPGVSADSERSSPPAEETDEEADATAVKKTAEYRNGRVQAGQGLDIKTTTRPVFSKYTRVTALPRNPMVEITFDRTGKVKKAMIVQSSGYKDVDEPILDAVHGWTAKGKELERLAPTGSGSLLKVVITMRFH